LSAGRKMRFPARSALRPHGRRPPGRADARRRAGSPRPPSPPFRPRATSPRAGRYPAVMKTQTKRKTRPATKPPPKTTPPAGEPAAQPHVDQTLVPDGLPRAERIDHENDLA